MRKWADDQNVLMIGLSQMSRAAARDLTSRSSRGRLGRGCVADVRADQRSAHTVQAIGELGRRDRRDPLDASLSVGKSRLGEGDRVVPVQFHGPSGRYRVTGNAVTGRARRAADTANSAADGLATL
ncbi:MAG: hypothetical protein IPH80_30550 [Myxococcales bacterium]|nr:hypothetical protein [Myxococcales bacterium]